MEKLGKILVCLLSFAAMAISCTTANTFTLSAGNHTATFTAHDVLSIQPSEKNDTLLGAWTKSYYFNVGSGKMQIQIQEKQDYG